MRWSTALVVFGLVACKGTMDDDKSSSDPFSDTGPRADSGDGIDSDSPPVDDTAEGDGEGVPVVPGGPGVGLVVEGDTGGSNIVADSVREYSGTQGADGWYYGYVEPSTSDEWVQMGHFLEGVTTPGWYSDPAHYWTSIADDAAHPNGLITSEGRSPMEQWAVRRWVSDEVGLLHVNSRLAKNYEDGTTNGIDARVVVDGVEVAAWRIQGWDIVGVDSVVDITVREGSNVDFVLDPHEAEDLSDRTTWTIIITK